MYWSRQIKLQYCAALAVLGLLLFRWLLMDMFPLLDKTEARYAEIARLMMETQEWIVLQIDYGMPFLAKPPLSSWLAALSMSLFGVNELAVRFPSFLLLIVLLIFLGWQVNAKGESFYLPALILLTTPEFMLHTGVVSTDASLVFCTTIAMLSFWKAIQRYALWYWKYLIFIFLGLGLLAKGPVALIIPLPAILIWCFVHRYNFIELARKIKLFTGIFIALLISLPWYLMAELQSPGFLKYFLLGEHLGRFLDSGWQGDLYGVGHSQPIGMIWIFLMVFGFPWIFLVIAYVWKVRKTVFRDPWTSFLIIWMLWVPLFFTISKNILHTYILPSTIPMALLVVQIWKSRISLKQFAVLAAIFPLLLLTAAAIFLGNKELSYWLRTDKYLIQEAVQEAPAQILYWKNKSYSAQFYLDSPIPVVEDAQGLDRYLHQGENTFILVPQKMVSSFLYTQKEAPKILGSHRKATLYKIESCISNRPNSTTHK